VLIRNIIQIALSLLFTPCYLLAQTDCPCPKQTGYRTPNKYGKLLSQLAKKDALLAVLPNLQNADEVLNGMYFNYTSTPNGDYKFIRLRFEPGTAINFNYDGGVWLSVNPCQPLTEISMTIERQKNDREVKVITRTTAYEYYLQSLVVAELSTSDLLKRIAYLQGGGENLKPFLRELRSITGLKIDCDSKKPIRIDSLSAQINRKKIDIQKLVYDFYLLPYQNSEESISPKLQQAVLSITGGKGSEQIPTYLNSNLNPAPYKLKARVSLNEISLYFPLLMRGTKPAEIKVNVLELVYDQHKGLNFKGQHSICMQTARLQGSNIFIQSAEGFIDLSQNLTSLNVKYIRDRLPSLEQDTNSVLFLPTASVVLANSSIKRNLTASRVFITGSTAEFTVAIPIKAIRKNTIIIQDGFDEKTIRIKDLKNQLQNSSTEVRIFTDNYFNDVNPSYLYIQVYIHPEKSKKIWTK